MWLASLRLPGLGFSSLWLACGWLWTSLLSAFQLCEFTIEFRRSVLNSRIRFGSLSGILKRLLSCGDIGFRRFLNLGSELRDLLASLIAQAHFMAARAGDIFACLLRILGNPRLLLRGIRELLILLRRGSFRGVCGLLCLCLSLLRCLRGSLSLLLSLTGLLGRLLIFRLFLPTRLSGLLRGILCTLRGSGCFLGCLCGFARLLCGVLRSSGGLLRLAGCGGFFSHLRCRLRGLRSLRGLVSCGVGLFGGLRISSVVRLSFGILRSFLSCLCGLRGFLRGLRCFICRGLCGLCLRHGWWILCSLLRECCCLLRRLRSLLRLSGCFGGLLRCFLILRLLIAEILCGLISCSLRLLGLRCGLGRLLCGFRSLFGDALC